MTCGRTCICARISVALTRHESEGGTIRGIYLTTDDRKALAKCNSKQFGMKCHPLSFDGHPLREGKNSAVYSGVGVAKSVPKKLSARTVVPVIHTSPPEKKSHSPMVGPNGVTGLSDSSSEVRP